MEDRPPAVRTHPPCGELAALLAHRQPADLAAEALSLLLAEFGATAASLWYAARPPDARNEQLESRAVVLPEELDVDGGWGGVVHEPGGTGRCTGEVPVL